MAASYNPRKIKPSELEKLKRSLAEFGFVQPVVVNRRTSTIVGGHQRVKAAQALGLESIPVVYVELDEARERALNLGLNRISGEWEEGALAEVLEGLQVDPNIDVALTGFDPPEIDELTHVDTTPLDPADVFGREPEDLARKYGGATAPQRGSVPWRVWNDLGLVQPDALDLGAGKDRQAGVTRYDPFHAPDPAPLRRQWRTVALNYVLNVQPAEHLVVELLALAYHLVEPDGRVLVAIRSDVKRDGWTDRGYQSARSREAWAKLLELFFSHEPAAGPFHGFICRRRAT
jgi:hypothetical protein